MNRCPPLSTRLGAAAASTLLGTLLFEGALRLAYPALPSIAALEGTDFQLETLVSADTGGAAGLCAEVETFLSHRSRWGPQQAGPPPLGPGQPLSGGTIGAPVPPPGPPGPPRTGGPLPKHGESVAAKELTFGEGAPARTLWLVGDSVTYGLGVEPDETFGALLAERLARRTGAAVASRNLGIPGAGYCAALRRLDAELTTATPDLVLITLFADDLEERSLLVVQGRLVAPPDRARPGVLRALVSTSYVANLAWHRAIAAMPAHTPDGRVVTQEDIEAFGVTAAAMRDRVEARGGTPLFVLLPAPSEASCPDDPDARCQWLSQDLGRMAGALDAHTVPYLDLRGWWPHNQVHLLPEEASGLAEGGVAMHPNPLGHELLAGIVWERMLAPIVPAGVALTAR